MESGKRCCGARRSWREDSELRLPLDVEPTAWATVSLTALGDRLASNLLHEGLRQSADLRVLGGHGRERTAVSLQYIPLLRVLDLDISAQAAQRSAAQRGGGERDSTLLIGRHGYLRRHSLAHGPEQCRGAFPTVNPYDLFYQLAEHERVGFREQLLALAGQGVDAGRLASVSLASTAGLSRSADPVPRRHVVEIRGMAFHPQALEVRRGDTIVWANRDIVPHTATSTRKAGWNTGPLGQGKSSEHVARQAGEDPYFCQLHPVMLGKLIIR